MILVDRRGARAGHRDASRGRMSWTRLRPAGGRGPRRDAAGRDRCTSGSASPTAAGLARMERPAELRAARAARACGASTGWPLPTSPRPGRPRPRGVRCRPRARPARWARRRGPRVRVVDRHAGRLVGYVLRAARRTAADQVGPVVARTCRRGGAAWPARPAVGPRTGRFFLDAPAAPRWRARAARISAFASSGRSRRMYRGGRPRLRRRRSQASRSSVPSSADAEAPSALRRRGARLGQRPCAMSGLVRDRSTRATPGRPPPPRRGLRARGGSGRGR